MTAWLQDDMRLDIAIAVALEVSVLRLNRADTERERAEAEAFNRRLWQSAAALAPTAPIAEDRDGLSGAAGRVASGRLSCDEVSALNIAFARRLAGRAATGGALRHILAEWRVFRVAAPGAEFGSWLVRRLEDLAEPPMARAA